MQPASADFEFYLFSFTFCRIFEFSQLIVLSLYNKKLRKLKNLLKNKLRKLKNLLKLVALNF